MRALSLRQPRDLLGTLPVIGRLFRPDLNGPAPAIGRYAHRSFLRRYKWACYLALTLFALMYGFAFAIFGRYLMVQLTFPLAILTGLTLWVLPDFAAPPERLLGGLLTGYLFALLCWPDYVALAVPGLPWVTAVRLLGYPLAFVLLISVAMSATFRARLAEILSAAPIIWKLMVAFIAIGFLTLPLSSNLLASINKFIVAQMAWTTTFFASVYLFVQPGRVRRFAYCLWGITLYVCAIGLYEARYSKLPWAGRIPSFLKIEDEQVQRVIAGIARASTGVYRVTSKFGISLGLGEFLAMALPFILHLMVTTRRGWVRFGTAASLPLIFFISLKTDSRLAFIGFFVSLLLYGFAWAVTFWRRNPRNVLAPAIVLAYPFLISAFLALSFLWRRLEVLVWGGGAQQSSTDSRKTQYEMGMHILMKNPIGHGMGEGASSLGYVSRGGILTIDTYYLAVALEYGIIGFFIYYGMFAYATWRAGRVGFETRDPDVMFLMPVSIAFINFLIIKSVFSQQENHSLAFILLGITISLLWRHRQQTQGKALLP